MRYLEERGVGFDAGDCPGADRPRRGPLRPRASASRAVRPDADGRLPGLPGGRRRRPSPRAASARAPGATVGKLLGPDGGDEGRRRHRQPAACPAASSSGRSSRSTRSATSSTPRPAGRRRRARSGRLRPARLGTLLGARPALGPARASRHTNTTIGVVATNARAEQRGHQQGRADGPRRPGAGGPARLTRCTTATRSSPWRSAPAPGRPGRSTSSVVGIAAAEVGRAGDSSERCTTATSPRRRPGRSRSHAPDGRETTGVGHEAGFRRRRGRRHGAGRRRWLEKGYSVVAVGSRTRGVGGEAGGAAARTAGRRVPAGGRRRWPTSSSSRLPTTPSRAVAAEPALAARAGRSSTAAAPPRPTSSSRLGGWRARRRLPSPPDLRLARAGAPEPPGHDLRARGRRAAALGSWPSWRRRSAAPGFGSGRRTRSSTTPRP